MEDISEWHVPYGKNAMKKGNDLLIPVEPNYGNRKKAGTMQICMSSEQFKQLRLLLDEHQDRERLIEIAEKELRIFMQEQEVALEAKKKELREKLGLEGDPDLPWNLK